MEVYIGLMIWSILSGSVFLFKINIKLKKIIYLLLTYIPLVLISGLRSWYVGVDTKLFHQWYEGTRNINILDWKWFVTLSDGSSIEFGFSYIGYIFNLFFL